MNSKWMGREHTIADIMCLILALYVAFNIYISVFHLVSYGFVYLFCGSIFLLSILCAAEGRKQSICQEMIPWLVTICFVLISTIRVDVVSLYTLRFLTFFVMLLGISRSKNISLAAFYILMLNGFFHSCGVFVNAVAYSTWNGWMKILFRKSEFDFDTTVVTAQINQGYLTGFTHNAGFAATFIVIGIAAALVLRKTMKKGIFYISLAVMLAALLMTGKRGQILFLFVSFVVTYIVLSKNTNVFLKRLLLVGIILIIIYVVGYGVYSSGTMHSLDRVFELVYGDKNQDFTSGRLDLWKNAIRLFKKNWLLGIGWNQFTEIYGKEPHNAYLQMFCETGVFGGVMFIVTLMVVLASSVKKWMDRYRRREEVVVLSASIFYQIYFILFSFVENSMNNIEPLIAYFLFLIIGMTHGSMPITANNNQNK